MTFPLLPIRAAHSSRPPSYIRWRKIKGVLTDEKVDSVGFPSPASPSEPPPEKNVCPEEYDYVYSESFGTVSQRTGTTHLSRVTWGYPDFASLMRD